MDAIKLSSSEFPELAALYSGQEITMKLTARVISRELTNGKEYISMIPEVIEVIRDERRVNPSEILLSNINQKLGMVNTPIT